MAWTGCGQGELVGEGCAGWSREAESVAAESGVLLQVQHSLLRIEEELIRFSSISGVSARLWSLGEMGGMLANSSTG